jgi:hypothetical protein
VTVQILNGGGADLATHQEQALALAQQTGDPIRIGRAWWNLGLAVRFHDPQRAVEHYQQALDLARNVDAPGASDLVASVLLDLMIGMAIMGRYGDGLEYGREAEKAFRALGNRPMLADALGGAALLHQARGEVAEARAKASEGLHIGIELGNPWGVLYNAWSLSLIEVDSGHFEAALAMVEPRIPQAAELGFAVFEGQLLWVASSTYLELGQWARGLALAEHSRAAFVRAGGPMWTTYAAGLFGQALLNTGDVSGAGAVLEPVWRPGEDAHSRLEGFSTAGPAIAEWALRAGRLEHGLRFCDWFLDTLVPQGADRLRGAIHFFRGCMLRQRATGSNQAGARSAVGPHPEPRDQGGAGDELCRARELLSRAEVNVLLWRVDAELANLWAEHGDLARATDHRQRAVALLQRLADGIQDPALRASFLARPDVQQVLA